MKNLWIKQFKPVKNSKCRLFCFPYAGGGSLIFRLWHEYLPSYVEVCPVKLPGRENRIREALFDDMSLLIETLEKELAPFLDRPFAFFGHSLGSIIAFELMKRLRKRNMPLPFHLFVAGRRAPQIKPEPPIHKLPDEQFIEGLRNYGGTPEAVFQEQQLMDIFLPILRADLCLNDSYTYVPEYPFDCPITAFYGANDKIAGKNYVEAWKKQANSHFILYRIEGSHFFINEQTEQILKIISADMERTLKNKKGSKMKTYVFPGQGSQKKGMGESLFDEFSELTKKADDILGYSIKELCLNDPQNLLSQTNYTQPALYVVNALTWLKEISTKDKPGFLAGHSLGEYNALFAAGAFDFETGLKLVQERSRLMSLAKGGAMAAVIGLDEETINKIITENNFSKISIANYNSQDQIVISGLRQEIEKAKPVFEKAKAKLYVILPVSGAFHTQLMQKAKEEFAVFIDKLQFNPLQIPVIANVTAREYESDKIKELLCEQIISPVKWTDSIRYLMGKGKMEFEELGPGNVLSNLIKKLKKLPPFKKQETGDKKQEAGDKEKIENMPAPEKEKQEKITALTLGNADFKKEYGLKYAYIAGAMARGISSKELVTAMGRAGMMGYYGSGGQNMEILEKDLKAIKQELGDKPFGANLLHLPESPEKEEEIVDLFMGLGVRYVEAAAFMQMTPALVKYRVSGLYEKENAEVDSRNKVMGKISRPELAEAFYSPAPEQILEKLLAAGKISEKQAKLARKIPMADALCIEADSGGHTDHRTPYALVPAILQMRKQMAEKHGYKKFVFTGAAGGIGTPEAAAASFILGTDFILTGSINQCTVEAGTSDIVKDMLSQINVQDTDYAPAGDMFEFGAKVQVLKKGTFFPARANKLYNLYIQFDSLNSIDQKTKDQIQKLYFKKSFDEVYKETKEFFAERDPSQIEKAEKNPKHKMALIFRWYFGYSMRTAMQGKEDDKVNFQIHTGPALGAFNQWLKGTELKDWHNRHVDKIGIRLMEETAKILNERFEQLKSG
jgi:trans-AT polyketide synthase, acyltransferase and oxidoreductase domains